MRRAHLIRISNEVAAILRDPDLLVNAIADSILRGEGFDVFAMPPLTDEEAWAEALRLSSAPRAS